MKRTKTRPMLPSLPQRDLAANEIDDIHPGPDFVALVRQPIALAFRGGDNDAGDDLRGLIAEPS